MGRDNYIIFDRCPVSERFRKIVGDRRLRKRGFAPGTGADPKGSGGDVEGEPTGGLQAGAAG